MYIFYRTCYFTIAAVQKKCDFITQLSSSFGSGGLSCSFNDRDLIQYITWKQKYFHKGQDSAEEAKQGVLQLGKQPCGKVWVLSPNCFLDQDGKEDKGNYIWLKNVPAFKNQAGREISLEEFVCEVYQPMIATTSTDTGTLFGTLLKNLRSCLQHNFPSAVLLLGGSVMTFHYRKIIEIMTFCPQVMAVGPPSTGKTLSLQASLSLFGANNAKNLYNSCTRAYLLQRCSVSTIPFAIDDPNIAGDIGDIIMSLYNGTLSANLAQGGLHPLSCPLYCANFDFGSNER